MKITSDLWSPESSGRLDEPRNVEGEGRVVGEGFPHEREVTYLIALHEATGSHESLQAIPLQSLDFLLELRTGCLLLADAVPISVDLVLETAVLIAFLLDEHDDLLEYGGLVLIGVGNGMLIDDLAEGLDIG
jgi:hypothetical protein